MNSQDNRSTSTDEGIIGSQFAVGGDDHTRIRTAPYPPRYLLADVTKASGSSPKGRVFREQTFHDTLCTGGRKKVASSTNKVVRDAHSTSLLSQIWLALSSIFCVTSTAYYMPDDDYILYTGSMEDEDLTDIDASRILQHSKSFIENSLKVFDWSNDFPCTPTVFSLVFSKEGDYANDKILLGRDLFSEGQRIMKLFTGLTREKGLTMNWVLRATTKDVNVHTCDVPESPWLAIKSDCIIRRDKEMILELMMDDTRSSEYDDSMEGYEVTKKHFSLSFIESVMLEDKSYGHD